MGERRFGGLRWKKRGYRDSAFPGQHNICSVCVCVCVCERERENVYR